MDIKAHVRDPRHEAAYRRDRDSACRGCCRFGEPTPRTRQRFVANRTNSIFLIAIDSLRTWLMVDPTKQPPPFAACKVFEETNAIFALMGADPLVFDPRQIVRQELRTRTSIQMLRT